MLAPYIKKLANSKFNLVLGPDLGLFLQLSNDKLLLDEYELEDIRKLYTSLILASEYNLENYLEAAHFEWNVMDKKDKAEQIINIGLEKAKQKIGEFEELLESINN